MPSEDWKYRSFDTVLSQKILHSEMCKNVADILCLGIYTCNVVSLLSEFHPRTFDNKRYHFGKYMYDSVKVQISKNAYYNLMLPLFMPFYNKILHVYLIDEGWNQNPKAEQSALSGNKILKWILFPNTALDDRPKCCQYLANSYG